MSSSFYNPYSMSYTPCLENKTILQIIPNLGAGGAEQACIDMAAGFAKRGGAALVISAGGSRVAEIEKFGARHFTWPVNSKNPLVIFWNALRLAWFILNKKVDIIHVRSRAPAWSAWIASRLTGRPFVTTFHAAYKFSNPLKKFYNRIMTRGDRIIAISPFIAEHIEEIYAVDPAKIRVVNRGIDLDKFLPENVSEERRQALRKTWSIKEEQRIVFMPARISPIKGHELIVEAMALLSGEMRDVVAVIAGDDQGRKAYRAKLEGRIAANGLQNRVKIVGHCNDMPAAYSLADVVVIPSLVPEGFGRTSVEAMAMSVPVIASDLGALRYLVQEGETGWLLPPSNPKAWADTIKHALSLSPNECTRMAEAAKQRVHTYFSLGRMVVDTLLVYDELLSKGK